MRIRLQTPLAPGYPQCDLLSIWRRHERALLLRRRQPCQNMSKRNRVRAYAELGPPFFGDDLCETVDAGFGEPVVGLSGVAVYTGGGGDVDYAAVLAIGDAEIGRSLADELEGGGVVEREDIVPLFVGHLGGGVSIAWKSRGGVDRGGQSTEMQQMLMVYWRVCTL